MELDSVRSLKLEMAEHWLAKAAETVVARGGTKSLHLAESAPVRGLALGIARKTGGGYMLAVRVQDRALESVPLLETISEKARREVDIRYIGRVSKQMAPLWHQIRQRPLLIGSSIGHVAITFGTLGGFVRPRLEKKLCVLSNNHVLANENRAKKGDAIVQQGRLDGGADPNDMVARLLAFKRLKPKNNKVDCAMAEISEGVGADTRKLNTFGQLSGLGPEQLHEGDGVSKLGRTTGLTHGKVTAFEIDGIVVDFEIGDLMFNDQIEIEGADNAAFSAGGDSGSLIVNESKQAVGLLFANGNHGGTNGKGLSYANPIHAVLKALKAELVV